MLVPVGIKYMHVHPQDYGKRDKKMHGDMYGDGGGSQPEMVAC